MGFMIHTTHDARALVHLRKSRCSQQNLCRHVSINRRDYLVESPMQCICGNWTAGQKESRYPHTHLKICPHKNPTARKLCCETRRRALQFASLPCARLQHAVSILLNDSFFSLVVRLCTMMRP